MRGLTSTILLVVVLAGLGGYIYFVELKKPETTADSKPKAFTVAADQIEELQIAVTGGDTSRAQRAANAWKLVEPVQADGDNSELTNMASSLAALDVQRVVDEKPADLAQYGLNPPKVEVGFRAKGQKDLTRLQLGDKTPAGGDVYAKKPDEPRVFLVTSVTSDTFTRTAFDLRDKTVLKFDRDKVDGLEISRDGTTLQFARNGTDWTIVKPTPMRADYGVVEGVLTNLSTTLMQKVVGPDATPAELKSYGLDRPTATASAIMGSSRATLILGRTENAETYARDASRPMVVMVAPTIVSELAKELTAFRRKDMFDMRSFTANRLELKRGDQTLVFEKSKGSDGKDVWKNAAGAVVDAAKAEDLVTKLSSLRAQTFEAQSDAALKTPALVATVRFDDKKMETVTFARSGATVIAARPDEPGTATLETMGFDDALKALDAAK